MHTRLHRLLVTAVVGALPAVAAPGAIRTTAVVAAGDCKDAALLGALEQAHELTRTHLRDKLIDPRTVLRAVRTPPGRGLEDIKRQVQAAESLLYGGRADRALELIDDALADLDRLDPLSRPWPLTTTALVLQAQMLRNLERPRDATEALQRIVRLEPQFTLSADAWPPSTLQALEAVRRAVTRARKGTLAITSTVPGATVYLDGRDMGKLSGPLSLAPGTYALVLGFHDQLSFVHRVTVTAGKTRAERVDLAFEGAVGLRAPVCLTADGDDTFPLKLASAATAEQVLVLRSGDRAGPPYLMGVLYDVARGERIRNAGVPREHLADLVAYLFTGKPEQVAEGKPPPPPPPEGSLQNDVTLVPVREPAPGVVAAPPSSPQGGLGGPRVASIVVGSAGVALVAAGVVVGITGHGDRERLDFLRLQAGGRLPAAPPAVALETRELLDRTFLNHVVSWSLIGVGAGAVLAGALGFVLFPGAARVAVTPGPGVLMVSGGF